jgi:hypothetical protein
LSPGLITTYYTITTNQTPRLTMCLWRPCAAATICDLRWLRHLTQTRGSCPPLSRHGHQGQFRPAWPTLCYQLYAILDSINSRKRPESRFRVQVFDRTRCPFDPPALICLPRDNSIVVSPQLPRHDATSSNIKTKLSRQAEPT